MKVIINKIVRAGLFLSLTLLMVSCFDTRDDFFDSLNSDPEIRLMNSLAKNDSVLVDSLKFHFKSSVRYNVNLSVEDLNSNLKRLWIQEKVGRAEFMINGQPTLFFNRPTSGMMEVTFTPTELGLHSFDVFVEDNFGKRRRVNTSIVVFDNMPPSASFEMRSRRILSSLEYIIDASGSFDQDDSYGGEIVQYEYRIDGITFTTKESQLFHIFDTPGPHNVSVRVKDNNEVWSTINEQTVVVTD